MSLVLLTVVITAPGLRLPRTGAVKPGGVPVIHASYDTDIDRGRPVDCMEIVPDFGGRRRALRSWIGLVDRGHLGPAGVTV